MPTQRAVVPAMENLRRFTKRRSHKPQPSELYPQYASLFRRMDSDNSGELSLEEIRSALVKDEDFARATGAPRGCVLA